MPLLKKGILLPVKGVDYSLPSVFVEDRVSFASNMRYQKGLLRKRPGKTVVGGQTPNQDQIMGYGVLETSSESKYLLRASKRVIQNLNTATNVWSTISIITFNSSDTNFMFFANVAESNIIISTNYIDAIYQWNGSGNQTILGGSPPKAKYCAYLSPYLLLGYTDDGSSVEPWRVAWSDTGDPETWSGGNSGEALITDEPSPIQNIAKLNEFVAVYKKNSLALGRKVDPPTVFSFETIKSGIGLAAPRAFADTGGEHFFMSANDFHMWNGIRIEDIGAPVREEVFSKISRANIDQCFAVHVQEQYEVWFFIVVSGGTYPTEVWRYNYKLGWWYQDTCSSLTSAVKWESVSVLDWNSASGTWNQQQIAWDDATISSSWEQIMLGTSTGYSQYVDYTTTDDNGTAVSSYVISKTFIADTLEERERWLQLDVWAKGPGDLYVDYSTDFGSTWTTIPYDSSTDYVTLDETMTLYNFFLDVWASQISFRFRNANSMETFYLQAFYPYYLARERDVAYRSA